MKKRIVTAMLAAAMTVSLAACGAFVPWRMVHARVSSSPEVKKLISPKRW